MFKEYSRILVYEDSRVHSKTTPKSTDTGFGYSTSYLPDNPILYANNNFGKVLKNELSSLGSEFFSEVTDFGKWVDVRVTHHDYRTGKSSSKTYLIVFDKPSQGDGIIVNTSNRYRTISGVSQAASYIRSSVQALKNDSGRNI